MNFNDLARQANLKALWVLIAQGDEAYFKTAPKPSGATVGPAIYYAQTQNPQQTLEVIRPKRDLSVLPVIVHIHGGGWLYGDRNSYYRYYAMELAKRGFAVLNINYRLAFDYPYPACIEDVMSVLSWIESNASEQHLDRSRVFLVGDSAGAHLSALAALIHTSPALQQRYRIQPSTVTVRALGLSCGVYDMTRMVHSSYDLPMTKAMMQTLFNRSDYTKHPLYPYTSVSAHLHERFPPAYVLSTKSDIPLIKETFAFLDDLDMHRLPYKKRILPLKAKRFHVFNIKMIYPESVEVMDEMTTWFKTFL
jgi:acetyl esterase/lipase